jgi:hypothetical protein
MEMPLSVDRVCRSLSPAVPSEVYATYWRFAAERQKIFFRRARGELYPWTDDPILTKHKFTNAYRASDRVSQYLIRNVIYAGDQNPAEVLFRILLFKFFNKIETWELLGRTVESISFKDYSYKKYDKILSSAFEKGTRIYSAAYIMPSGNGLYGTIRKHQMHLKLLESMMRDGLSDRLQATRTMLEGFEILRSYPTIGDFLAYQFITDINYSEVTNYTESEFVVPGPGARSGVHKCFESLGGLSEIDIIRLVCDLQNQEFDRLGLTFETLWGRRLQLIDCQNLFCEVDKYSRIYHPSVRGIAARTKIKQLYRINPAPIDYWFPPKWNLNAKLPAPSKRNPVRMLF